MQIERKDCRADAKMHLANERTLIVGANEAPERDARLARCEQIRSNKYGRRAHGPGVVYKMKAVNTT